MYSYLIQRQLFVLYVLTFLICLQAATIWETGYNSQLKHLILLSTHIVLLIK